MKGPYKPYTDPEISIGHKAKHSIYDLEPQELEWLRDQIIDKINVCDDGEFLMDLGLDLGVL